MIDIRRTWWSTRVPRHAVVARVFDAVASDDGANWSVRFTVEGLDPKWTTPRVIHGVDELQAVLLALQLIRTILDSDPSSAGQLSLEPGASQPTGLGLDL